MNEHKQDNSENNKLLELKWVTQTISENHAAASAFYVNISLLLYEIGRGI